jgi:hypothetical protein
MGIILLLLLCLFSLTGYSRPKEASGSYGDLLFFTALDKTVLRHVITPMEALELVKEKYATNFEKVIPEEDTGEYYYSLDVAAYYLVYEGIDEEGRYLIHLYEFVLDEPETGLGHTYTYGWYTVNRLTGEIQLQNE